MDNAAYRLSLIEELVRVQNTDAHYNRDILTIAGFLDNAQLLNHLASCRQQAYDHRTKAKVQR